MLATQAFDDDDDAMYEALRPYAPAVVPPHSRASVPSQPAVHGGAGVAAGAGAGVGVGAAAAAAAPTMAGVLTASVFASAVPFPVASPPTLPAAAPPPPQASRGGASGSAAVETLPVVPTRYARIASLKPHDIADVFGIVVDYSGVRSTRGTDKFCRLAILDASTSEPLDVMCFSTDPARLRHDLVLGDVVRAHALNIREHNSNVQAFMQHRSTIVVFNRDDRVVSAAGAHSMDDADASAVKSLRRWFLQHSATTQTFIKPAFERSVASVLQSSADSSVDMCVCLASWSKRDGCTVLLVWDGTGTNSGGGPQISPPPCASPMNMGAILHVAMSHAPGFLVGAEHLRRGAWLRLRQFKVFRSSDGGRCVTSDQHSTVLALPDTCLEISTRLEAYAKACAAMTAMHVRPAAEVSLVRSPSMATTRIGDVLLSRTVPNKYRLRCRVLAFWPADLAGLCIRRAPSLSSSDSEDHRGSLEYFFTLCLDDGTGSLVAIVCGEHARNLLPGLPPCDFSQNEQSKLVLAKQLARLQQPRAVFDCCVASYTTPGPVAGGPSYLNFQVVDTALLPVV